MLQLANRPAGVFRRALVLWQNAVVFQPLTGRKEWKFFAVLPKAAPGLAAAWWTALLLRGVLPAAFAIAMGVLVAAVQHGSALARPLQPRRPHSGLALRPTH